MLGYYSIVRQFVTNDHLPPRFHRLCSDIEEEKVHGTIYPGESITPQKH